jgi:hypothetical protein
VLRRGERVSTSLKQKDSAKNGVEGKSSVANARQGRSQVINSFYKRSKFRQEEFIDPRNGYYQKSRSEWVMDKQRSFRLPLLPIRYQQTS